MIPKTINYVWVGGAPKNPLIEKCIESWKKYMPDYEIVEWNESNFDLDSVPFAREAYDNKKWAFVSDVIRTYVLYRHGGVYFDTDIELLRKPCNIFDKGTVLGYENKWLLGAHVMASEPDHPIFKKLYEQYLNDKFVIDGMFNLKTIPNRLSEIVFDYLDKRHLPNKEYEFNEVHLYPKEYFTAQKTDYPAVTVHHFVGSWQSETRLTHFQWTVLRVRLKLLNWSYAFKSNVSTIEKENKIWRWALKKTAENDKKNKKIHIKL